MSVLGLGSRAPIGLQLAAAAALMALTIVPSFERHREASRWTCGTMVASSGEPLRGDVLLPDDIDIPVAPAPMPLSGWGHPDLAPWPHGMVIGMRPDARDFVLSTQPGIVDTLLSALVRALRVVSA